MTSINFLLAQHELQVCIFSLTVTIKSDVLVYQWRKYMFGSTISTNQPEAVIEVLQGELWYGDVSVLPKSTFFGCLKRELHVFIKYT